MNDIRDRVKEFMGRHNEEFPAKKVSAHERAIKLYFRRCQRT